MQAKSERFELRLEQDLIDRVDGWRAAERDIPSRAEAIRRLMEAGLDQHTDREVRFSDGEKLLFMMLRDIERGLKIKNGDIDADFVADAVYGGHYWALKWELSGLFHTERDPDVVVSEVVNFLDMWGFIELAIDKMSPADKAAVGKSKTRFSGRSEFPGFDGNNETNHLAIARFLIEKMDRFTSFASRDLNSHAPMIDSYRGMYATFEPLRRTLVGKTLTVSQVIEIFGAA